MIDLSFELEKTVKVNIKAEEHTLIMRIPKNVLLQHKMFIITRSFALGNTDALDAINKFTIENCELSGTNGNRVLLENLDLVDYTVISDTYLEYLHSFFSQALKTQKK